MGSASRGVAVGKGFREVIGRRSIVSPCLISSTMPADAVVLERMKGWGQEAKLRPRTHTASRTYDHGYIAP